jgi:ATP-binding cassette subfamily B protein
VPITILFTSLISVLPPLLIGDMIDALQRRDAGSAMLQLLYYVAIAVIFGLVHLLSSFATNVFSESMARNIRIGLFAKLNRATFQSITAFRLGEIINRVVGDVQTLSTLSEYSLFPTLSGICTLAALIAAMMHEDFRLGILAVGLALLTLAPLHVAAPRIASLAKCQSEAADDFYGTLNESGTLSALALLRIAAAARRQMDKVRAVTHRMLTLNIRQGVVSDVASLASALAGTLGPAAIMAAGAYLVVRGEITTGKIVTMLLYQSRIAGPFASISALQIVFARLSVTTQRLLEILDLPDERSGSIPFSLGQLVARNLRVQRGERAVLVDVELKIDRGCHAAIVGPSGSGKSTFASLITRLYDPDEGVVEIDGIDLRHFQLESLRCAATVVPQESLVFDASLLENIILANPSAGSEEIRHVIDTCRLQEVVLRLPAGIATELGQGGFRLSGGERQRICLARALLQHPSLLILDEALSGVDFELERRILADIRDSFRDRTLIVITHRVASIADFARIFVMHEGEVVAHGTHEALRRCNDWYATLAAPSPTPTAL